MQNSSLSRKRKSRFGADFLEDGGRNHAACFRDFLDAHGDRRPIADGYGTSTKFRVTKAVLAKWKLDLTFLGRVGNRRRTYDRLNLARASDVFPSTDNDHRSRLTFSARTLIGLPEDPAGIQLIHVLSLAQSVYRSGCGLSALAPAKTSSAGGSEFMSPVFPMMLSTSATIERDSS